MLRFGRRRIELTDKRMHVLTPQPRRCSCRMCIGVGIDIDDQMRQPRPHSALLEAIACLRLDLGFSLARNDTNELPSLGPVHVLAFADWSAQAVDHFAPFGGDCAAKIFEPSSPERPIEIAFAENHGLAHRRSFSISVRENATSGPDIRCDCKAPFSSCTR